MYLAIWVVLFIILVILAWWVMGVYNVRVPRPNEVQFDFDTLQAAFDEFPKALWFRNNPCIFDKYLGCKCQRYVVLDSKGEVVYDNKSRNAKCGISFSSSSQSSSCKDGVCNFSSRGGNNKRRMTYLPNWQIHNTTEYIQATVLGKARVIRDRTANLAIQVSDANNYRVVHISERIYNECDEEF